MNHVVARSLFAALSLALCLICLDHSNSQEPQVGGLPVAQQDGDIPGVEVQARGPVHEAFATPTSESRATPLIPRRPPVNIDEMPPDEKPEGDVVWIGGYWAWDDDRDDFLWVSGCWRAKPASREWVPGYWRENGDRWQWVSGFWAVQPTGNQVSEVVYHPEPPAMPNVAPPPPPQQPDMFYIPGNWVWVDTHYVWRAGYYSRVRPGYCYVPGHYRWSPYGYIHVAGYWDAAMPRRGLLYAPVVVNTLVVGPRFVYTPAFAVSDALVLDTLFVRPSCGHYYFGDYYGPRYVGLGFTSCVVYSQRHYDPVITYQRWEYRNNPAWFNLQVNLVLDRNAGRSPLPPRTLAQQRIVQQKNIVNNNVTINKNVTNVTNITNVTNVTNVLAPTKTVVAARGGRTVAVDQTARVQAKQSSQTMQQAAIQQRIKTETVTPGAAAPNKARAAKLNVPPLRADNRPVDTRPGDVRKDNRPGDKGPADKRAADNRPPDRRPDNRPRTDPPTKGGNPNPPRTIPDTKTFDPKKPAANPQPLLPGTNPPPTTNGDPNGQRKGIPPPRKSPERRNPPPRDQDRDKKDRK